MGLVGRFFSWLRGSDHPASGAGFTLVGEPFPTPLPCSYGTLDCIGDIDGGHADDCPAWRVIETPDAYHLVGPDGWDEASVAKESIEYAQYEFGALPEEYDELFYALDDVDIATCPIGGCYGRLGAVCPTHDEMYL